MCEVACKEEGHYGWIICSIGEVVELDSFDGGGLSVWEGLMLKCWVVSSLGGLVSWVLVSDCLREEGRPWQGLNVGPWLCGGLGKWEVGHK